MTYHCDKGAPVGRFSCDCGYVFSRKPGGKPVVIEFGPMFKTKLIRCAEEGMSLRAAARALFVSTKTVVHQARRIGVHNPWAAVDNEPPKKDPIFQAMRKKWRGIQKSNPEASITTCRKLAPACYAWLYRNDRAWLMAHRPADNPEARQRRPVRNWPHIDEATVGILIALADEIRTEVPPVRVSVAELERRMDRPGWFFTRRNKLPRCAKALAQLAEPVELYQCRRVLWATGELAHSKAGLTASAVRRLAGIKGKSAPIIEMLLAAVLTPRKGPYVPDRHRGVA